MTITPETRVGQLAVTAPLSTRVFARHGIDYCCGGGTSLAAACAARGLDLTQVISELEGELATSASDITRWDEAPLGELIAHIVSAYHRHHDVEMPRLAAMAAKVRAVHGDKDPERLAAIHDTFVQLQRELAEHMAREEQVLFPMIQAGRGRLAAAPIAVMEDEHETTGAALRRLRELTRDYQVPAGACTTWRALWHGLAAFEEAVHQHISLETNVLFPRALGHELNANRP